MGSGLGRLCKNFGLEVCMTRLMYTNSSIIMLVCCKIQLRVKKKSKVVLYNIRTEGVKYLTEGTPSIC